jgi:glycosyltransferase involved in cell wall biosynthesis
MTPRVSVVVPLYNKVKFVTRALNSIARQTWADFEAIVVDDGSTDGSGELAAGYPDRRFRVIRQENAGPGAARNRGIDEASGEFLAFLDADDEWLPEYLESSLQLLDRYGPEVVTVTSGYVEQPMNRAPVEMWRKRGISDGVHRVGPQTPCRELAHMVAYMSAWSTVARSAVVRRWGGFYSRDRCRYAEEGPLWLKILLNQAVCFQLRPLVQVHREASELGGNFTGPRPIEAVLLDPGEAEGPCPPELLGLLRQFYARCAAKTAVVLGSWGDYDRARALMARYVRRRDIPLPLYLLARLASNPASALPGRLLRRLIAPGQSRRRLIWTDL